MRGIKKARLKRGACREKAAGEAGEAAGKVGEAAAEAGEAAAQVPSLPAGASYEWPLSRREFVVGVGAAAVGATSLGARAWASPTIAPPAAEVPAIHPVAVSLTINGDEKHANIDPRTSLLDLLRENLQLTGTKKGCDHGQCGSCTVLVNGRRVNSCLTLAASVDGDQITTIEGVARGEDLHPIQQAFLDNDGLQCGYCTPGQILSVVALLSEAKNGAPSFVTRDLRRSGPVDLTEEEIRERMSGNICRCGAYPGIIAAIHQVQGKTPVQGKTATTSMLNRSSEEDSSAAL
jgi:xanthine dehydrogenase YagT iron-sulfur-binding subunit